jgi:hypothetical protein
VPTSHSGYCGITSGMRIWKQKLIMLIDSDDSEWFCTLVVIKLLNVMMLYLERVCFSGRSVPGLAINSCR